MSNCLEYNIDVENNHVSFAYVSRYNPSFVHEMECWLVLSVGQDWELVTGKRQNWEFG